MKVIPSNLLLTALSMLCILPAAYTQEVLINTASHPHHQEKKLKKQTFTDTLEVPFIDDFAKYIGYPDPNYWIDNQAYMNHQYPRNSISIGAATLDAIDHEGNLYGTPNNNTFEADYLTSKPINLEYNPNDSIYLSFFYQPGGYGDTPEPRDSLIVQFLNVEENQWETVWGVSYNKDSVMEEFDKVRNKTKIHYTDSTGHKQFIQTLIPVLKNDYLKKGFQFRFHNYVSTTSPSSKPSKSGNVDHWHVNFVRLDKNRHHQDTIINDITITEPLQSLLNNYESIPWRHFPQAIDYEMNNYIEITYKNIGDKTINISREFEIINSMGDRDTVFFTGGGGEDIPPYTTETYPRKINYIFPYNEQDSALFKIRSYLITDTISERAPYRWNDTTQFMQKFFNYYAYDDGTAENGYGFHGEGSQNVWVAYKFDTYKADTLQAVQIYFNQTLDSANQQPFTIHVWDHDDGKPGELIYSQNSQKPVFEDSLNKFKNYPLKEKIFLEEGTFYIGYEKYSNKMLNIGFDVNRNNKDKLFYNLHGDWVQSKFDGSLMMRPVFGKHIPYTGDDDVTQIENQDKTKDKDVNIYPNPAYDFVNIKIEDDDNHNYTYSIYNMQGRLIKSNAHLENNINISNLSAGVYILQIQDKTEQTQITKKIIVREK
ncbi:MAG: T9SS type A sorting domain-containing protein [Bacteroidales bacterium]